MAEENWKLGISAGLWRGPYWSLRAQDDPGVEADRGRGHGSRARCGLPAESDGERTECFPKTTSKNRT